MDIDQFKKNFKIIFVTLLVIIAVISVFYIVYSFSIMWQAMAAGVTIFLLLIILFLLLALVVYLGIRNLWLKRELNKSESKVKILKRELIMLRKNESQENIKENQK
ncbi:hypothetical protein [Methanobacterium alcaliphilum]|uniref:hypothetical protein n=1 Tax=Methanobacterium alcaliphilum TaxID=392018 RepID=UPI002009FEBB|nr:hypothetical protein [Methanobacterium alcaliphilum]MCK9152004.1 hypothetical protein [Methanobacterium alcaliphilum]